MSCSSLKNNLRQIFWLTILTATEKCPVFYLNFSKTRTLDCCSIVTRNNLWLWLQFRLLQLENLFLQNILKWAEGQTCSLNLLKQGNLSICQHQLAKRISFFTNNSQWLLLTGKHQCSVSLLIPKIFKSTYFEAHLLLKIFHEIDKKLKIILKEF